MLTLRLMPTMFKGKSKIHVVHNEQEILHSDRIIHLTRRWERERVKIKNDKDDRAKSIVISDKSKSSISHKFILF